MRISSVVQRRTRAPSRLILCVLAACMASAVSAIGHLTPLVELVNAMRPQWEKWCSKTRSEPRSVSMRNSGHMENLNDRVFLQPRWGGQLSELFAMGPVQFG